MSKLSGLKNWFSKGKKPKSIISKEKNEVLKIYSDLENSKTEIKYLDDKYEEFILKSLELDFDDFKSYADQNLSNGYPPISPKNNYMYNANTNQVFTPPTFWCLYDSNGREFNLFKTESVCISIGYTYEEKSRTFSISNSSITLLLAMRQKIYQ